MVYLALKNINTQIELIYDAEYLDKMWHKKVTQQERNEPL